ncbi:uncharacterized protein STEHIDRAFT_56499, partial [Stereum hirsutum FP-91666 SS1]|uniref:uncharacterized protein n=1 Tax=Stereum hirsutum (strain FP-91666) TaxID=721885 RepID=UPI000440E6A7
IYKIHRYFLIRESVVFRDMFSVPQGEIETVEGQSDENPIMVADTTRAEFDSLLRFLYFGYDYKPPIEDWISLLSISSRFLCDLIRQRAIDELTSRRKRSGGVTPIKQVVLSVKYDIESWLEPACANLVRESQTLSREDAAQLPMEIVLLLLRSREVFYSRENIPCKTCSVPLGSLNTPTSSAWPGASSTGGTGGFGGFGRAAPPDPVPRRTPEDIISEQMRLLNINQKTNSSSDPVTLVSLLGDPLYLVSFLTKAEDSLHSCRDERLASVFGGSSNSIFAMCSAWTSVHTYPSLSFNIFVDCLKSTIVALWLE